MMNFSAEQRLCMTGKALRAPSITHGPRAGSPRPVTDILMDQQSAVRRATVLLKHDGFEVIASFECAGSPPSVHVMPNYRTAALIASGEAVYYRFGRDAAGMETRYGQFHAEDVRVTWIEKGAR